jgi:hypothetical protein
VLCSRLICLFFLVYILPNMDHDTMWEVMISYVIMHRTIVESKPDDLSTIKIGNFMASCLGPREEDIVTIVTASLNP